MPLPLIEHLERHLGSIARGWSLGEAGGRAPFLVVHMGRSTSRSRARGTGRRWRAEGSGGPRGGAQVLSTLGLSDFPLRVGTDGNRLRQELILMLRASEGPRNLPAVLQQVGLEALYRDAAYLPGEVLGPRGEIRTGSAMAAFYVALPVYLPDSFQVCHALDVPVVFAWLVPITAREAEYVRSHGADAFESLLESANPDLLDMSRAAIV